MIPASAVIEAARILQVAVPVLVEGLRLMKCVVEACEVELVDKDAPDVAARFRAAKHAAAWQATDPPPRLGD